MPIHSIIEGFEEIVMALHFLNIRLSSGEPIKFHHAFVSSYDDKFNDEKYFELRCLAYTRSNDDGSKTGYQLFVVFS